MCDTIPSCAVAYGRPFHFSTDPPRIAFEHTLPPPRGLEARHPKPRPLGRAVPPDRAVADSPAFVAGERPSTSRG